jgi:hypothetical protein
VQNSFRDYWFLIISASLHTRLVQYYLLVAGTEGKTATRQTGSSDSCCGLAI